MKELWTTGITVDYGYSGGGKYGWSAKCNWQGGNFMQSGYMEGEIRTRYYEPTITEAINNVLELMTAFGIKPINIISDSEFALYRNEEEEQAEEMMQQMRIEATKRGWSYYF